MARLYELLLEGVEVPEGERCVPSPAQAERLASLWLRGLSASDLAREVRRLRKTGRDEAHAEPLSGAELGDGLAPLTLVTAAAPTKPASSVIWGPDRSNGLRITPDAEGSDEPSLGPRPAPPTLSPLCWAPFTAWGA